VSALEVRDAVVTAIKNDAILFSVDPGLPPGLLRFVEGYGGKINDASLKRIALKSPAAAVVWLGGDGLTEGGGESVDDNFAIFLFVASAGKRQEQLRDRMLLTITDRLTKLVLGNDFGESTTRKVKRLNIYSEKLDAMGIAGATVTWQQRICLPADLTAADLDAFVTLNADWIKAREGSEPDPPVDTYDATDTITLEQPP
jgi:hypothetical protein